MVRSALPTAQPDVLTELISRHSPESLTDFIRIKQIIVISEPFGTDAERRLAEIIASRSRIWLSGFVLCSAAAVFDWLGAGPLYIRTLLNVYSVGVIAVLAALAIQNLVVLRNQPLELSEKILLTLSAEGSVEPVERDFLHAYREIRRAYESIAQKAIRAAIIDATKVVVAKKSGT
jgi:hypothetical protein